MAKLIFANAQLRKLMEHNTKATQWRLGLAEAIKRYEKAIGREWDFIQDIPDEYYRSSEPTIFFVKDRGIYLMAGAVMDPWPTDDSHICYANGYDPNKGDVYDKARAAVGGDDFTETLKVEAGLEKAINEGADIVLNVTKTRFSVEAVMPKSK